MPKCKTRYGVNGLVLLIARIICTSMKVVVVQTTSKQGGKTIMLSGYKMVPLVKLEPATSQFTVTDQVL